MSEPSKKSFRNTAWCPLLIVGSIVAFGAYVGDKPQPVNDGIVETTARSMMALYNLPDSLSQQQVATWRWQCAEALVQHSRYPEIIGEICVFKGERKE